MEGNIEEQEEQGIHEATIDLKDGADAFAMECIQACEEVAGQGRGRSRSRLGVGYPQHAVE